MNLIEKFAEAIKIHEGWFQGSRSQRNHNPGNLKFARQAKTIGQDGAGFAIFANDQDGWTALIRQIEIAISGQSRIYNPEMTILQFFEKYAPSSDNNNPKKYAEDVAWRIGKSVETKIKELADDTEKKETQKLELFFAGEKIFEKEIK